THFSVLIDTVINSILAIFNSVLKSTPRFTANQGSITENQALKNLQGRVRMVLSYFFAQLCLWTAGRPGWLLVLGSKNSNERSIRHFAKYDCSSGDVNPIGGLSRINLHLFLSYCAQTFNLMTVR
ncbi:unnamed protein product, partial [Didymodactylos carnosus]